MRGKRIPRKPFESRNYLVGFLGSIENREYPKFSPKRLVATPKVIARSRMAEFCKSSPPGPRRPFSTARRHRSQKAQCRAPAIAIRKSWRIRRSRWRRAGLRPDYRFFEAMRQGCVVICDRLPPHWLYVGCPASTDRRLEQPGNRGEGTVADPEHLHRLAPPIIGLVGDRGFSLRARRRPSHRDMFGGRSGQK